MPEHAYDGDKSKSIIKELLLDEKITEEQVQANIEKSVIDYSVPLESVMGPCRRLLMASAALK